MKKLTYDYVKNCFDEAGYHLISSEYVNSTTPLQYQCECGNVAFMRFGNFQQGKRCNKCSSKKAADKRRLAIDDVRKIFEEAGCILLTDTYINGKEKVKYKCSCGCVSEIAYNNFQQGQRCSNCKGQRIAQKTRHSYVEVKGMFTEKNCVLLSEEYTSNRQKLQYTCECGNISWIRLYDFVRGHRCKTCKIEKLRKTNLEVRGVEHPSQCPEVRAKTIATFQKNYGCDNPMQNSVVFSKSKSKSYATKHYTFPSGKVVDIQGYEDIALDELIIVHEEQDIVTEKDIIPVIKYTLEGKHKVYFPDIYLPKCNMIIEVKSTYTYVKEIDKNIAKAKATNNSGYKFQFWIYDNKGNKEVKTI